MAELPTLCARCAFELHFPAVLVRVNDEQLHIRPGRPLIEALLAIVEQGHEIEINQCRGMGIKADAMINGETVCLGHIPWLMDDAASLGARRMARSW